jgi:hypothetical protein
VRQLIYRQNYLEHSFHALSRFTYSLMCGNQKLFLLKRKNGGVAQSIGVSWKGMAGTTGLEPATSAVTGQRSNQLNYVPSLFSLG